MRPTIPTHLVFGCAQGAKHQKLEPQRQAQHQTQQCVGVRLPKHRPSSSSDDRATTFPMMMVGLFRKREASPPIRRARKPALPAAHRWRSGDGRSTYQQMQWGLEDAASSFDHGRCAFEHGRQPEQRHAGRDDRVVRYLAMGPQEVQQGTHHMRQSFHLIRRLTPGATPKVQTIARYVPPPRSLCYHCSQGTEAAGDG